MVDAERFAETADRLLRGLLREAIGYRIEERIPYYRGMSGCMVEAPMLWIRHSRFPILFIAYDRRRPDVLPDVIKQLQMANATEYFAVLVVVPTGSGTGNEAEELRQTVARSVYSHDFVVLDCQHLASIIARNSPRRLVEIVLQQGIPLSNLAPYVVVGPVPENMFFGREEEIKTILQTIQHGDHAILGGRRIGKSSVLRRVDRLLQDDGRYHPTYLNCEWMVRNEDLLLAVGHGLDQTLDTTDPAVFRQLAIALQEQVSPRRVVFLLDEVDELLADDARSTPSGRLFKSFRALSHEGVCGFVFSGSRTLHQHLHDPQSPFFNFCECIILGPLTKEGAAEIITKPMYELGVKLPDEEALVERIADLTSCHPNLVQWLCVGLMKSMAARRVTLADLDRIVTGEGFDEYYMETAWGIATPLEKLVTLCLPECGVPISGLLETLSDFGIHDQQAVKEALEMLQMCALIKRRDGDYVFVMSQFPTIVRRREDVPSLVQSLVREVGV